MFEISSESHRAMLPHSQTMKKLSCDAMSVTDAGYRPGHQAKIAAYQNTAT